MPSVPAVTAPVPGNIGAFIPGNDTTRGWEFTTTGCTVTHMGYWDNGGDGLVNSHVVAIFDSSHAQVITATIPSGTSATLGVDNIRYVPITPVVLPAGTYRCGAFYTVTFDDEPSKNWQDGSGNGPIGAAGISYVGPRFDAALTPALTDPVNVSANSFGVFGPNFMILSGPACDLSVSPTSVSLIVGASQGFTASGTSTPVTWSITEVGGGTLGGATGTSVTYTAPVTPGTYHLVATSDADATCKDTIPITVVAVSGGPTKGIQRPLPFYRRRRGRAQFLGHGFWGKIIPPPVVPVCALWKVRAVGFNDGQTICADDYGLPTEFLFCGPIQDCAISVAEKPLVDANGLAAGLPGGVMLERDGTDVRNNDTHHQAFWALEISFDLTD